jgi:hypothetical protein
MGKANIVEDMAGAPPLALPGERDTGHRPFSISQLVFFSMLHEGGENARWRSE